MNEAQALRAVRNVIRLDALADRIIAPVRRELTRIFDEVAAVVEKMDEAPSARDEVPSARGNSLFRQARWRTIEAQLRVVLGPTDRLARNRLIDGLATAIPTQLEEAERGLRAAGITPYQTAAEVLPPGVSIGLPPPTTPGATSIPSVFPGAPSLTPTQLYRVAADTKVLGRRLEDLFESTVDEATGQLRPSFFTRSQINTIDQVVKRGFLLGETNEEIARNLRPGGIADAMARREADTLARTAVMQMNADAHNAFWDANSSVIAGWEYDALMDYRTCPICAPWDGRTAVKRSDLPETPRHPRCRCSLLPLTETEVELRKEQGPQRRTVIELEPYSGPDSKPAETDTQRVYARPVTVDGKRYWRVARDIKQPDHPLTHGEFLVQTSDTNLRQALGSQGRAAKFRRHITDGLSPDAALVRVTHDLRDPSVPGISARKRTRNLPEMGRSASPLQPPRVRQIPRRRRPAS